MEETAEMMIKILNEKIEVEKELLPDTLIEEIKLDSLDLIHFLFLLGQKTGVEIEDETIVSEEIQTIADLAAYVDESRS